MNTSWNQLADRASTLIIASSNPGKLAEFRSLFHSFAFAIIPQSEFAVPDADETGLSFVENAIIKARNACLHTGMPAIADDSGLEIDALNGEPGIYSARYSGARDADNEANNRLVLEKLAGIPAEERSARYQCVLVFMRHAKDATPLICQASWEGAILTQQQGASGFGYDPIFWVPEKNCTAAELGKEEKNTISHRGKAMRQFLQAFR